MAEQPLSLDRVDPFASGVGTPMAGKLVAKPAYMGEVIKAVEEYRETGNSVRFQG